MQVACDRALRMSVQSFRMEMARGGAFFDLMTAQAETLVGSIIRTAACTGLHTVDERLPRWLLLARERLGKDELPLTLAAQSLQQTGAIRCREDGSTFWVSRRSRPSPVSARTRITAMCT